MTQTVAAPAVSDVVGDAVSPSTTSALPPWTLPEAPVGRGWQRRPLPPAVVTALGGELADLDRFEAQLLTCWVAVLSRCLGEPEVGTAVSDEAGRWQRVGGRVTGQTWRELGAALTRSPLAGTAHSALDVRGTGSADGVALLVRAYPDDGEWGVEYDTGQVSHTAAERVLGYLDHALTVALADPGQPVDLADMLSDEEYRRQLHDLCGPRVNNGPDGFVESFRSRVAVHPDRLALRHRDTDLSYAELDEASDRLARHLVAHGVRPGQAVAVVSDRHVDWVVAMLATFKACAVYLPVRPDFPAARVEDQLLRADCAVALVDPAGAALMAQVTALGSWQGRVLTGDDLAGEPVAVPLPAPALGQAAYVYFTSGSTGRPKGAVCAHDGMINHLWAKVDDHDLGPDDVVTQTASQCFDISLWQVCAPLLVGGACVIVDIDDQLDIQAFATLLAANQVTTVQIVPSYLEILLAHLEPGVVRLPRLKSLSVTGEALKADLVRRWFAAVPSVRLVNAYGATEVSDDTMHEVLDGPPRRDLAVVTVGRPLRNMRVYVVDEQRRLMPEGARGEIVFAGVCVGAGYLNDPQRTAAAFASDPYHPGERLYHSGDLGRWLPEGRLEFLGRRDEQVKIRGLRVEIGEIQAALLRVPGITAAAVVPMGEGNGARLVGFYVADHEVASVDLHDLLSARLPAYMVPAHHFRVSALPLNENGKTDKRRLKELAEELAAGTHAFEPPQTAAEQRLATVWAEVLGMAAGRVSRHDNFFDLGGTSLSAIHLLMRMDNQLSLADIMAEPVLAAQARILEGHSAESATLLHPLNAVVPGRPTLVCLPDAGGNAINFRRLAVAATGHAHVVAVEPPGHDITRPDDELVPLAELVDRLVAELTGQADLGEVYLWGQGAAAATALVAARRLTEAGVTVGGLLVGWGDGTPDALVELPERMAALSDDEVIDQLRLRQAYVGVDGAEPGRLPFVARAYRHDWTHAAPVLHRARHELGITCPVVEVTVGDGPALLTDVHAGVVSRRLADTSGDLAREYPDQLVAVLADCLRGGSIRS